jgi:outer membrane protein OmpA-like peptidoglycan-associated protein
MRSSPALARSSALALVLAAALALGLGAGCAKPEQIKQCYPMASWSAPVFQCGAAVAPAPVVAEVAPPPPPPPAEPEPPPPPRVEVKDDKIELNEKVNFETGKAALLPASETLLDEVAKVMTDHPEIQKLRVEGHTDNQGGAAYNLRLSNNRAKAVRDYLVKKGIDAKRLDSKGFGQTKPLGDNKTPDGREQNRRVEMKILKRAKK